VIGMEKYLDFSGLKYFYSKLTEKFALLGGSITANDINALAGNYDVETGAALTMRSIIGDSITEDDIEKIIERQ
jgi:hypothetical protein